jgi:hypothetical protein
VIKGQVDSESARFETLAKDAAHIITAFVLSHLRMVKKRWLPITGEVRA